MCQPRLKPSVFTLEIPSAVSQTKCIRITVALEIRPSSAFTLGPRV